MHKRSTDNTNVLILRDGVEVLENKFKLYDTMSVDGFVRIPENEFYKIDITKKYFTHFNLEQTTHEKGKNYALVRLLRHGYYDEENKIEVLPLLSLENIFVVECVDVKNYLKYSEINTEYFLYSLSSMKNVEDLKKIIHERYDISMPNLSKEDMEALGVGYTLFCFNRVV